MYKNLQKKDVILDTEHKTSTPVSVAVEHKITDENLFGDSLPNELITQDVPKQVVEQ